MVVTKIPGMPALPKKKRVCAYVRVSTTKDAMLHSLSAQVSYYNQYIQNHSDWLYCGVYIDEGITGTKLKQRKEFQRMLTDCKAGKIDMIITKSISRFARNTIVLLETVRELKAMNIDVFFEEHNIHTMSATGEIMLTVLASFAQEESRSVSENMKWRVRKNFEAGIPWNGTILGYRLVDGKYMIVPEEAQVVRNIYEWYLSGMGYTNIAQRLNASGAVTRYGRTFNHTTVDWILHNYSYTGNLLLQTFFSEDHITKKMRVNTGEKPMFHAEQTHDAIIPMEMYQAVQAEILRRASKYEKLSNQHQTELSGKVFCKNCGKRCRRKKRHNKQVWICNTFNTKGKEACPSKAVPEDILLPLSQDFGLESIEQIYLCNNNEIEFRFTDGNVETILWQDPSRIDSWTPEMKQKAREQYYANNNNDSGNQEAVS